MRLDKLAPVLYMARHSGPSIDVAEKTRTLDQVQVRGRWASEATVRRYEKHAQLAKQWLMLDEMAKKPALLFSRQIANYLSGTLRVIVPTGL